jgi:Recombination endonuclease VII
MLAKQGGGCAICKSVFSNNGKGNAWFDVDHDHTTGRVRGLLCRDCNVTVGVVEKKSAKISLIHEYLALHLEFDPKDEPKKDA